MDIYNLIKNLVSPEDSSDTLEDLESVTRVEVIDEDGRAYVRHNLADVKIAYQDNKRTLKVFVNRGMS